MSAADPRVEAAARVLLEDNPLNDEIRLWEVPSIREHCFAVAIAVMAAADAVDPLRAEEVPRCTSTEGGGVRCELPAGHHPAEAHWISLETIEARLHHRVTLIDPQAFTERSTKP